MIRWDDEKNRQLKRDRGISFEQIAEMIINKEFLAIVKHSKRANQRLFILRIQGYVWVVPFVTANDGETYFLKTAFPSRKFNRIYGESTDGQVQA